MTPPLSVWAFYLANLLAVSGYCVAIALVNRRDGFHGRGPMPIQLRVAAGVFFSCCSGIHLELAVLVYTGVIVDPVDGGVPWHFMAVVTIKVAALYTYLWTAAAVTDLPPLAPALGELRFLSRREVEIAAIAELIRKTQESDERERLRIRSEDSTRSASGRDPL